MQQAGARKTGTRDTTGRFIAEPSKQQAARSSAPPAVHVIAYSSARIVQLPSVIRNAVPSFRAMLMASPVFML